MRNILILSAAAILTGCPAEPPTPPEISDACALEYAVAIETVAPSLGATLEDACDAAFDAVHLADEGSEDEWYKYHTAAWENPTDDLLKECTDDLMVRATLLMDEHILKFRCIASCDGHDPDIC